MKINPRDLDRLLSQDDELIDSVERKFDLELMEKNRLERAAKELHKESLLRKAQLEK